MDRVDVLLISDDRHLVELVSRRCPRGVGLRCISPGAITDDLLLRSAAVWVDLDHGPVRIPKPERGRVTYFHTGAPEPGYGSDGISVHKPCSPAVVDVLWASALAELDSPHPDPEHLLPGWLLDFHELNLRLLARRCVSDLPARLGFRHASLFLLDQGQDVLTLAATTHRRPLDLAVRMQPGSGQLMTSVARSGRLLHTDQAARELAARGLPAHPERGYADEGCLVAPLISDGQLWGVLNFSGRARSLATELGLPLRSVFAFLARSVHHASAFEQARTEARVDGLTGLYNQRWMQEALAKEIRRAQRFGTALSVLMADLDGLKAVNDRHGHAAGDCLLRHVAGRIGTVLRQFDGAARVGGDEFVIMLPGTRLSGARQVARRLLDAVRQDAAQYQETLLPISASIGIAEWRAGLDAHQLLAAADRAMYAAKGRGRDKLAAEPATAPRSGEPETLPPAAERQRSEPGAALGAGEVAAGAPRRGRGAR